MRDLAQAVQTIEATRSHPRIAVNLKAKLLEGEQKRPAVLSNIAHGGVFVATSDPARVGADVVVRFRLLALECEATGKVVWNDVESDTPGFGVQFESKNQRMESFTKSLLILSENLRPLFLADILHARIELAI